MSRQKRSNVYWFWVEFIAGFVFALIGVVLYNSFYPHANNWSLLVAAIIGSLVGSGVISAYRAAVKKDETDDN